MKWRNTVNNYGWVAIFFHWLVALGFIALFVLGLWMTGLDYYHEWYYRAPYLHKAIGMLLLFVMFPRWLWRLLNPLPSAVDSTVIKQRLALWVHRAFYLLLALLLMSGYFIATADGQGITIWSFVDVPAVISHLPRQADIAGWVHEWLAYLIMAMMFLHMMAAMKHHFIDKNDSLKRMLGRAR